MLRRTAVSDKLPRLAISNTQVIHCPSHINSDQKREGNDVRTIQVTTTGLCTTMAQTGNKSVYCGIPQSGGNECMNGTFSKGYMCGAVLDCGPKNYKMVDTGVDTSAKILVAANEVERIDKCLLDWNYTLQNSLGLGMIAPCETAHNKKKKAAPTTATETNLDLKTTTVRGKTRTMTTRYTETLSSGGSKVSVKGIVLGMVAGVVLVGML